MKDLEEKVFESFEEFKEFLRMQKEGDTWMRCAIRGLKLLDLPDAPIFIRPSPHGHTVDNGKEVYEVQASIDAIEETMQHTRLAVQYPTDSGYRIAPVRDTAIRSLCDRAKLYGTTVKNKPLILNAGFCEYPGAALLLIRDEKLSAAHSGEPSDYAVLPAYDLLLALKSSLDYNFPGNVFQRGTVSHGLTTATITFPKQAPALLQSYNNLLKKKNRSPLNNLTPSLLFTTNDIAGCGANLHPMYIIDGRYIRIGSPLSVTHKNYHTVADFAINADKVYSLLQESTSKIAELLNIPIRHPIDCFKNIVVAYSLPRREAAAALDIFDASRPLDVTAHDIYWALWEIIDQMDAESTTTEKRMMVEENITRVTQARWSDLDHILSTI